MKRRWDVVWVGYSNYYGIDTEHGEYLRPPHAPHEKARKSFRSYLGADWSRRFSSKHRWITASMGSFRTTTVIVRAGHALIRDPNDNLEYPEYDGTRYATWFFGDDRNVWKVFYWIRERWDGLRFGLNRDAS